MIDSSSLPRWKKQAKSISPTLHVNLHILSPLSEKVFTPHFCQSNEEIGVCLFGFFLDKDDSPFQFHVHFYSPVNTAR